MASIITLYNLISILLYGVAMGFCCIAWGRSGRREYWSAGVLFFIYLAETVVLLWQTLQGAGESWDPLAVTAALAFTVLETYYFGRIIYAVFRAEMSAFFYIWLCLVVIVIGLLSTSPLDPYLCDYLAFVAGTLLLSGIYWHLWTQADEVTRERVPPEFQWLAGIHFSLGFLAMIHSISNLSLFQRAPSAGWRTIYVDSICLVTTLFFILLCQREFGILVVRERLAPCPAAEPEELTEDGLESGESAPLPEVVSVSEARLAAFCESYELTAREQEILRLMLAGKSNQEISDVLYITIGTVKAHIHSIFGKLDISRRGQLLNRLMDWDAL